MERERQQVTRLVKGCVFCKTSVRSCGTPCFLFMKKWWRCISFVDNCLLERIFMTGQTEEIVCLVKKHVCWEDSRKFLLTSSTLSWFTCEWRFSLALKRPKKSYFMWQIMNSLTLNCCATRISFQTQVFDEFLFFLLERILFSCLLETRILGMYFSVNDLNFRDDEYNWSRHHMIPTCILFVSLFFRLISFPFVSCLVSTVSNSFLSMIYDAQSTERRVWRRRWRDEAITFVCHNPFFLLNVFFIEVDTRSAADERKRVTKKSDEEGRQKRETVLWLLF